MATTKFSVSAYTADGVTTDYLITWDYLDSDHIAVYVDGTPNYDPQSTYSFELINSTTVRVTDEFGNAVPSGSEIEIRRETPILDRAVTFNDGSALLAEDLNKNSDYLLYSMQEVLDTVEAAAQDGALAAQVATEELRDQTEVLRATTEGYKDETLAARNTTQTYLATVDADATAADNHRIAAAASEAAALASEQAAAASEAASASSEANSAASEAAALVSETNAAASAAAALVSQNAAATSEGNAAASETAAQTAQVAAEAALDELTDLYLGAKATAPTVDNDGNALQTGALYWNSTNDTMYVWNGSAWDTFNSTTGIADGATSTAITIGPDGRTTFGGYVEVGPIDTVSDYQGLSINNGKDSFYSDTVSFIDTKNNLQTVDAHMFIVHKPDGSSSLRLGTTPAGNRAIDRRVDRVCINGDGKVGINDYIPPTALAVKSANSGEAVLTLQNTSSSGYTGVEYKDTGGNVDLYVGLESGGGGARYNSMEGGHNFYINGNWAGGFNTNKDLITSGHMYSSGGSLVVGGTSTLLDATTTLDTTPRDFYFQYSGLLTTGTYLLSVYVDNSSWYTETWTGLMQWFSGGTNSNDASGIYMTGMGHAPNGAVVYARVQRRASNQSNQSIQLWSNTNRTPRVRVTAKRLA